MRFPSTTLVIIAAMTVPADAQDFGGLARRASTTIVRDLVSPVRLSGGAKPADRAKKVPNADMGVPPSSLPPSEGGIVVAENMPVISSDGVRVAKVNHTTTGGTTYGPNQTFFTADPYYRLRRIYGREATVHGGAAHLKMTAAQYRARNQNPD